MSVRRLYRDRWFPPEEFYTEDLCTRCGVCCGATDGHPCEHLVPRPGGGFQCAVYEDRIGLRRSVDGQEFACTSIKIVIECHGGYADCGYVKAIRRVRERMGQKSDDLGRLDQPPAS